MNRKLFIQNYEAYFGEFPVESPEIWDNFISGIPNLIDIQALMKSLSAKYIQSKVKPRIAHVQQSVNELLSDIKFDYKKNETICSYCSETTNNSGWFHYKKNGMYYATPCICEHGENIVNKTKSVKHCEKAVRERIIAKYFITDHDRLELASSTPVKRLVSKTAYEMGSEHPF